MHKRKQVLPIYRAIHQRRNLLPFLDLPVEILELIHLDRSVLIRRYADIWLHRAHFQKTAFRSARRKISTRNSFSVRIGAGQFLNLGRSEEHTSELQSQSNLV